MDIEGRKAFFKSSNENVPDDLINPLKKEDQPINFRMGVVGRVGRGVGKNLSPELAEMAKKIHLELFNRDHYFKHYLLNAPAQGHFRSVVKELPTPKEKENDNNVDKASRAIRKTGGLRYPHHHPGNRVSYGVDPELEDLKFHLTKKKQDQKKWKRRGHEQVWRNGHASNGHPVGRDSDEDSGQVFGRKWKSKPKLLMMMKRKEEFDEEEERKLMKRRDKEREREKMKRKKMRKVKDDMNGWDYNYN